MDPFLDISLAFKQTKGEICYNYFDTVQAFYCLRAYSAESHACVIINYTEGSQTFGQIIIKPHRAPAMLLKTDTRPTNTPSLVRFINNIDLLKIWMGRAVAIYKVVHINAVNFNVPSAQTLAALEVGHLVCAS